MRRVVITGLGVISPIGNDVNALWNKEYVELLRLRTLIQVIIR